MSVPMVKLAHVEALWSLSDDPMASLAALRESAVPGADAHETAVSLPAGWEVGVFYVRTNGVPYRIEPDPITGSRVVSRAAWQTPNRNVLKDGAFSSDHLPDADRFATPQAAIDALERALEGESK